MRFPNKDVHIYSAQALLARTVICEKVFIACPAWAYFLFVSPKMKVTKKKATFFNCSAEKRSYTLVSQFAYRRYGAEINAAAGGYWALYAWQPLSLCLAFFCRVSGNN